jgi:hypothetical protein
VDEKLDAYEQTRARVSARLVELRAEQKRMNWLAVPAIVATGVARWFGFIPMLLTATIALSIFCVAHYVVYMHIHESKLTLKQLKATLRTLRQV